MLKPKTMRITMMSRAVFLFLLCLASSVGAARAQTVYEVLPATPAAQETLRDTTRQAETILEGRPVPLLSASEAAQAAATHTSLPRASPIAIPDHYFTIVDTPLTVAAPGVLVNDYDPDGDTILANNATQPTNGTLNIVTSGAFTYTPDAGFTGTDEFIYAIRDGSIISEFVTVTIEVLPDPNRPPIAVPDTYTTPFDTPLTVSAPAVLVNDYDPDGDTILANNFTQPTNGTLTSIVTNGAFSYTPNPGFTGTDTFTYRIRDDENVLSEFVTVFIGVGAEVLLPVELTSFEAVRDGSRVLLSWKTASETNNAGFEIERAVDGTTFNRLGFVEGNGTTLEPQQYTFTDESQPFEAASLSYRLKQIDYDGTFAYSPLVEVDLAIPDAFAIHENFPNPFNRATRIRFELPNDTEVRLVVYDVLGREVMRLIDGVMPAGRHEAVFEAQALPSGMYTYRLQAGAFSQTRRMLLVK